MTSRRIIIETGSGSDLHGQDYTKAACRAVHDALHHSSLALFKTLGIDHTAMRIEARIGVQAPERIDVAAVAAQFPYGRVTVLPVRGGLDVVDPETGATTVMAAAGISVWVDIPEGRFRPAD